MDQAHQEVTLLSRGLGLLAIVALGFWLSACGAEARDDDSGVTGAAGEGAAPRPVYPESLPYARSVESFTPGEGAGFGQSLLPDVALGPPHGKGNTAGSLDVVSLGAGGEIVLGFGERTITDEAGPDFIVFENAFWPGGDTAEVYAELGEVSVSEDGETWLAFECDSAGDGAGAFPGCAGVTPTLAFDPLAVVPLDPEVTGGDGFDLADLGLAAASYVRIRDLETLESAGNSAGFDLDAVGLTHQE